jgi:hypothetical protein
MMRPNDLWRYCDGKRPVILHYHIYKNAGSTIDAVLEREFGVFFSAIHWNDPDAIIGHGELLSFVENHKTVSAISSHQIRYPKPTSGQVEFFDFCFIRHPLDRLFSLYSFLRKVHLDDRLTRVAKTMDLADFFSFLLDHHQEYACNPQVNLLARQGDSGLIGPDDLEAARVLLRDISLLGVVDAFDESLMLAEYALHPYFPRLRLHYSPQNVTNSQQMTFHQRLDLIRSRCGEQLCARLLETNQFDLALWREALLELQRRRQARPEHEYWLEEFRHRTERYQGGPRLRDKLLQWMKIPVQRTPSIQRNRSES